ncbi:MAG: septal ring lytic transglycosylase RlpA family protein [Acidobacteria bacterium]|nr:septal ring lytic transglycosylase RlpA family protein [Acidobacteriota bacterium]
MSEPTIEEQMTEEQPEKEGRKSTRIGVLAVTLGLTASLLASPMVKRESTVSQDKTQADNAVPKRHWFQIGKASWYGGSFNGKLTANGETYDMYDFTCAHKTLPLGSWIRVTNLKNKKWTFLRVNDRGPMVPGRIVDLSYAAAQKLGIEGLGKVRIEQVSPTDPKIADQMVAQVRMDDPARLQRIDEPVDTGFLAPGMLTAAAR